MKKSDQVLTELSKAALKRRDEMQDVEDLSPDIKTADIHLAEWDKFSSQVKMHIISTKKSHYSNEGHIEPIDLIESLNMRDFAGGSIIKYISRYSKNRNSKDLLKAAHYLSRLWEWEGENYEL